VTAALALPAFDAAALEIDYSSTVGSFIHFDGLSHFNFTPALNSFHITSGTAAGLLGDMNGTYTIGSVTTFFGVSTASVSGSGSLVIHDGAFDLTGTLVWANIVQVGAGDTLNVTATVNLTGITYGGSNADLLVLANAGAGTDVLTFQFGSTVALSTLKNSVNQTSFSGTIAAPDGGLTVASLGLALVGIEGLRRKLRN